MNMLGHAVAGASGKGEAAWLGGLRGGAAGGMKPDKSRKARGNSSRSSPSNRARGQRQPQEQGQHVLLNETASKWQVYEPLTGPQIRSGRTDFKKTKQAAERRRASMAYGNKHSPFQKQRKH